MNIRGVSFESDGTELEGDDGGSGSGENVASGDETSSDDEPIPEGITIGVPSINGSVKKHVKKKGSKDTVNTMDSKKTTDTAATTNTAQTSGTNAPPPPVLSGVDLSREELLKHRTFPICPHVSLDNALGSLVSLPVVESGIIIIQVISGELSKKARLELLLDDGYWPAFSSEKARSLNARWDQVGEGFIKELDFGRVWLRLNEADEGAKDDIIGEFKIDSKAFFDTCLVCSLLL